MENLNINSNIKFAVDGKIRDGNFEFVVTVNEKILALLQYLLHF